MELPVEVLDYISTFLTKQEAKCLSLCSSYMHSSMLRRIWKEPRFRQIRPKELLSFSHLPIKTLYARDFWYIDADYFKEIPSLRELIIQDDVLTVNDIRTLTKNHFKLIKLIFSLSIRQRLIYLEVIFYQIYKTNVSLLLMRIIFLVVVLNTWKS